MSSIKSLSNEICWKEITGADCVCIKCWSCKRKVKRSKLEAKQLAQILTNKEYWRTVPVNAYSCKWCDGWHVGHNRRAKKAA
jgi:hypothetical protein